MKAPKALAAVVLLALAPLAAAIDPPSVFTPDFKLKPDDYTVLMGVDAKLSPGLQKAPIIQHSKLFVRDWKQRTQHLEWEITAPQPDDYAAQVLIKRSSGPALRVEVTIGEKTLTGELPADAENWGRIVLPGTVRIPAGEKVPVSLHLAAADGTSPFNAEVHAVEIVRPLVRESLHKKALAVRSHPAWFQNARYGIMLHWVKQSAPSEGAPKSYQDAVAAFNVETFADEMQQTGAGFVVLTTAHAYQYFPAPIKALDRLLPGRTTERDLVAELAAALDRRGLKLFLYYHLGAFHDEPWLQASGFWKTDTTEFFQNWQAIITEVGERYKSKLAGWWFDDGTVTYYYRSAPWEKLNQAAKAGYPERMVGFNPWILGDATEFQDYFVNENDLDPRGWNHLLKPENHGIYPSGAHQGLQAAATFPADDTAWVHTATDHLPGPIKWNADQLTDIIQHFMALKSVPIFNLAITQDGYIAPKSIETFKEAAAKLPPR